MGSLSLAHELGVPIAYYVALRQTTVRDFSGQPETAEPSATLPCASGSEGLRLHVRSEEDLLMRLTKAPEARVFIPELDDGFELVNRSWEEESGSVGWFIDRAIRNLREALLGRGFDFSGLGSAQASARDTGIREQITELQKLRAVQREFTVFVRDPHGESKLTPPSEGVLKAHVERLHGEFPEWSYEPLQELRSLDVAGVSAHLLTRRPKTIVLLGAGASTSAGIPDFRTPGTGLYDNLQKYNLPRPTAVFELGFFRERPEPFYTLVRELWPGSHAPTPVHHFVKRLADAGLLLRCYTQNIDGLEEIAGVPEELIVQAHGHFKSARGVDTGCEVPIDEVRDAVVSGAGPEGLRERYGELVKPDIVFFGEALPARFGDLSAVDFPQCELLIIIGTSLKVAPFNELVGCVPPSCPRVLINREAAGVEAKNLQDVKNGMLRGGLRFADPARNKRDVFLEGTCDAGVQAISEACAW